MEQNNNNNLPINADHPLESLTGKWSFDVDRHLESLVLARTLNLCLKIDEELINGDDEEAAQSGGYESDDIISLVKHLEANKEYITIGEFLNCFDHNSQAYNEISQATFGNVSDHNYEGVPKNDNDELTKLRLELLNLKNQMECQRLRQEEQNIKANVNNELASKANQNAQNLRENLQKIPALNNPLNNHLNSSVPLTNPSNSDLSAALNVLAQNTIRLIGSQYMVQNVPKITSFRNFG